MAGVAETGAGDQEDPVLPGEAMAEGVDIRHLDEMDEGADAPRGGNPLDQPRVSLDPLGEQLPVSARMRQTRSEVVDQRPTSLRISAMEKLSTQLLPMSTFLLK
jgi:hypothetical protein